MVPLAGFSMPTTFTIEDCILTHLLSVEPVRLSLSSLYVSIELPTYCFLDPVALEKNASC